MEKYKELFQMSKYALDEEIKRYSRIDDKASKYLSALTVFAGFAGVVTKWSMDNFLPLKTTLDLSGIVSTILFVITLAIAWLFSFSVLKLHQLRSMSVDDKMIKFYDDNRLIDIYYALSKRCKEAYNENKEKAEKKAGYLAKSYRFMIISFISMLVVLSLMGAKLYNSKTSETNIQKEETVLWKAKRMIPRGEREIPINLRMRELLNRIQ